MTMKFPSSITLILEAVRVSNSFFTALRTSVRAALLIVVTSASAHAIPVTYTFSGHLIGGDLWKLPSIALDDAFRSSITIESSTPDSEPDSRHT